ncbi:MAG TPA: hypothetical protein PK431_01030 [Chitinophagales bacterium]|nr:hypothetical protein [Chitinophagales bacterium]
MNLLQNEIEIATSASRLITITNFRIVQEEMKFGSEYHISINHEDISSIEMGYKSKPILLIIGITACLSSFVSVHTAGFAGVIMSMMLGIILIAAWWFTRKYAVSVKPNGGTSLDCLFDASSNNAIQTFLTILEQAKLDRVNHLNNIIYKQNSNIQYPNQKSVSLKPYCPTCKNAIKLNDVFCENCGNKLK